jgi:hypothetical protein
MTSILQDVLEMSSCNLARFQLLEPGIFVFKPLQPPHISL